MPKLEVRQELLEKRLKQLQTQRAEIELQIGAIRGALGFADLEDDLIWTAILEMLLREQADPAVDVTGTDADSIDGGGELC